jgi:iron complex transport system substrate-binding protein
VRPWPVYPLEKAVADDPEVVVDGAVQEPADTLQRLSAIRAVRERRVVRLASDDLLRPGPRMIRGLRALFDALAPFRGAGR